MRNDVPPEVMELLFNHGYEDEVVDIVMANQDNGAYEVSDIPISPLTMLESDDKVIISPKVYDVYTKLVARISNIDTALEVPFFLLGKRKEIDGNSYILFEEIKYDIDKAESDFHVCNDINQFRELLNDDNYDVISIGHTHGNVSEDKKKKTLTENLSKEIKDKYNIRDVGLNVSIADIWQLDAFKQIAKLTNEKEVLETIIMYNGDMIVMVPDRVDKINNIQTILEDGKIVDIPTGLVSANKKSKK